MEELRDDDHSDAASVLASFRGQRGRLGQILAATVSSGRRSEGGTFTLVLRDTRGSRMLLSGCGAGWAGEPPRVAVQILIEAGFAADAAAAVLTHGVVRLSRTPDGTTVLERAVPDPVAELRLPPVPAAAFCIRPREPEQGP